MKPIKYRWRMWKTYTSKIDKTVHAVIVALYLILTAALLIDFSWFNILVIVGYTVIAYALIMKDVWGNAYNQTETLRATGWYLTKALKEWTFVKASKVGNHYYLDPDSPAEDPDETDDAMFTHEIVIRLGMDDEGEEITAYRIPDDMGLSSVVGALESVKLQYSYDVVGEDDE